MIRVCGKPVIDYAIERVRPNRLVLVEGRLDDASRYVRRRHASLDIQVVQQPDPMGPRDALACALDVTPDTDSVVVWYGDTLLFDELPRDFFATSRAIDDQSEWMIWDGQQFSLKPHEVVRDGRAFVGVMGTSDVPRLRAATNASYDEDLTEALSLLALPELEAREWHDIGVPARYYQTCAELLNRKTRVFNSFDYDSFSGLLTKRARGGDDARLTLEAESLWYETLSPRQSVFCPRLVESGVDFLCLTHEPGVQLSDLALYEDLTPSFWYYVISRLVDVVTTSFHSQAPALNFAADFVRHSEEIWVDGLRSRLDKSGLPHPVIEFLMATGRRVALASTPVGRMHGDLHLSNVLYEAQTGRLSLIDPRGRYGRYVGPAGSAMYDWCKLAYDCVHGFSAIVAGVEKPVVLRDAFERVAREYQVPIDLVLDGGIALMAAGIPLHYDSERRQSAFADTVVEYVETKTEGPA